MKKIFYYAGMIAIFLGIGLVAYLYYLTFANINVVTLNKPMEIRTQEVCAGEDIEIYLNFTKHKDITPEINWVMVGKNVYSLATANRTAAVGKTENAVYKSVHPTVRAGSYYVEVRIDYPITAWRKVSYIWSSNEFEVIECK